MNLHSHLFMTYDIDLTSEDKQGMWVFILTELQVAISNAAF